MLWENDWYWLCLGPSMYDLFFLPSRPARILKSTIQCWRLFCSLHRMKWLEAEELSKIKLVFWFDCLTRWCLAFDRFESALLYKSDFKYCTDLLSNCTQITNEDWDNITILPPIPFSIQSPFLIRLPVNPPPPVSIPSKPPRNIPLLSSRVISPKFPSIRSKFVTASRNVEIGIVVGILLLDLSRIDL